MYLKSLEKAREEFKRNKRLDTYIRMQLAQIRYPTDKDFLVAIFLGSQTTSGALDKNSRIAPALFFQPHFSNMEYELTVDEKTGKSLLFSEQYESIRSSRLFQQFKYVKTFTPMRRITTSYAATVRFMLDKEAQQQSDKAVVPDVMAIRVLNRSFMVDWQDRLYRDSVLVRFEDGKLNPKATFTALAEFLDIPYTESMTYCSGRDGLNPESLKGNVRGFDPATVYRTYDEFANDDERAFLEYCMRDAYAFYGYDLLYYKGEPVDEEWVKKKIKGFTCLDGYIVDSWKKRLCIVDEYKEGGTRAEKEMEAEVQRIISNYDENRLHIAKLLMGGLRFINKNGQPLRMMEPLKLDPALLEQPLYH